MARPTKRLTIAIKLAADTHSGQVDQAGEPYILHPLRVMMNVLPLGEEYGIVGVLHDAFEDGLTWSEVPDSIANATDTVIALGLLTKVPNVPYNIYLEALKDNPIALAVKRADVADNYERLYKLPDGATRDRLTAKYERARHILGKEQ